ncbi:hypothetical protein PoB_001002100 [Plakobranchus ocellatus]|uniref:Uncharacterized protein n=1 Tax=Plakobranchus ocellatus TaxID=259542 RepID=A0AAV3YM88_9GAST|nr:hypothetical protein PoB_001002100 [Plakobranchus ocellatus]
MKTDLAPDRVSGFRGCGIDLPSVASPSAISLPRTPTWEGIHWTTVCTLYQTLGRSCNATPPSSGVPLSYLMMNDSPVSMKPIKQVIIYKICQGVTLYKSFVQKRGTRCSWRTERDTVGPRLLPVVFVGYWKKR